MGSPAFTVSDLERSIIQRLRAAGLIDRLRSCYQPEKAPVAELSRPHAAD